MKMVMRPWLKQIFEDTRVPRRNMVELRSHGNEDTGKTAERFRGRGREKIGRGGGVDSTVGVQKMAISTLIERSLEVFNENRQLATSYA